MSSEDTQYLAEKLEQMRERGETWELKELETPSQPTVTVEGEEAILLAANNYLDLAADSRVREAAKDAIDEYGMGAGSDWSIAGYMEVQDELNEAIADFKNTEAGVSFQTGFAVNAGVLPQLLEDGDVFLSDELNHGSIIDGVRLSPADVKIYGHTDMGDLEDTLREVHDEYNRMIVVTDGVFSMDGDIAPMDEIQSLANEYGAMTYVDDAHGEGVLGGGHGIGTEFDLEQEIDFQMGTFSKAAGGFGGMFAGDQHVVEYAYNTARTWLLSAGYPPAIAAANMKALEIIEDEPDRVEKLWENREYFASELESMGWDTGRSETPIVPAMVGDSNKAQELGNRLFENGVFALPIVFPMVPRGEARIRNQLSAGHSKEDLDEALRVYEEVGRDLDLI
ncbi:2-amino-3-ketobutyrate coenzyme A ligase [Halodesulfurarchaeum formicicum]|uniref:2-amino-3-ketobutyrate coenzyme A ligase n=1 Tax=Halodesulfurarchaeum formicicum TaxID=1873524 RepID=A0A1D8S674_9EURY|nr:aminotransferase class I/II-fold pyridoxal phosphate-dependent enzyme [Halodesulfurarchaeum formicicum]AOW80838.1 2-amino-3-ketobutyrate coenzyme A ligase [Halodesulfurarchaeum formicicum]